MSPRQRKPPLSRCPRCGRQRRSWKVSSLCVLCLRETQPDSDALVGEVRDRRQARRQGAFSQLSLEQPPTHDGIPY